MEEVASAVEDDQQLLPGLHRDAAMECLSRLPLDAVARCRAVSRSWAFALRHYPSAHAFPSRPPFALACLCTARFDRSQRQSFLAWIFLSPAGLRSYVIPFYNLPSPDLPGRLHAYSSQTQVLATGTNLLLVRSRLQFTGCGDLSHSKSHGTGDADRYRISSCGRQQHSDGDGDAVMQPSVGGGGGGLQGFDVWQMKWCGDTQNPVAVPAMRVDRWGFAKAQVGKYVYVAGGEGPGAARSAERLDVETGVWEELPEMVRERSANPAGFVLGGCFYVAGGEFELTTSTEGRGLSQSGEVFDPEEGLWTLVEGMWPETLWGYGETCANVVVVKEVAYAATSASSMEVMMLSAESRQWRAWGKIPRVPGLDINHVRWYLQLLSVNDEELWVVLNGMANMPWLVFACKPDELPPGHGGGNDAGGVLKWEQRPFAVAPGIRHAILSGLAIRL